MGPTQTIRCQACQAVVNPAWETCAACRRPLNFDWSGAWQRLADMTAPLQPGDPRLPALDLALDHCAAAFVCGDVAAFRLAARQAEQTLTEPLPQSHQASAEPPLKVGWLVTYKDRQGRLRGGCDEREAGTVAGCEWTGSGWIIHLLNGTTILLKSVTSVGKTDAAGKVIAAWTTREHGFDGEGTRRP